MATRTKRTTRTNRISVTSESNGSKKVEKAQITAPVMKTARFKVRGLTAYMQNAVSQKVLTDLIGVQELGDEEKKKMRKIRPPKDFDKVWKDVQHVSSEGWIGIPCGAFRGSMISACRLTDHKQTHAKQAISVLADGYGGWSGTPLVRITKGKPRRTDMNVKLPSNGVIDVRARPMWEAGWEAIVTIRWDSTALSATDIVNLLSRAGEQCGIGEGRPCSPKSNGLGIGTFEVLGSVK